LVFIAFCEYMALTLVLMTDMEFSKTKTKCLDGAVSGTPTQLSDFLGSRLYTDSYKQQLCQLLRTVIAASRALHPHRAKKSLSEDRLFWQCVNLLQQCHYRLRLLIGLCQHSSGSLIDNLTACQLCRGQAIISITNS
jgi:hypothetical protein